jgi:ferritin-like metal-binding protein YciE
MQINNASQLFLAEVQDLYDAEKQLLRALPKMAKSVSDEELSTAFREHVEQTRGQIQRLEQIFEMLGQKAKSHPCQGMKGLMQETQELMDADSDERVGACALAGAGRKVEHYEMAGYISAQESAKGLGQSEAARLLAQSLEEEKEMDKRLKQASGRLLKEASRMSEEGEEEEQSSGRQQRGGSRSRGAEQRAQSGSEGRSGSRQSSGASRRTSGSGGQQSRSSGSQSSSRGGNQSRSASQQSRSASQQSRGGNQQARGSANGSKRASSKSNGSSNGKSQSRGGGRSGASSQTTTDHEEIRRWAEERGAHPACVKGTGKRGKDTGMIRLDFPGFTGADSLQEISWDEFFEKFDENQLALLYQEKTAGGQKSNFNKLVRREQ